MSVRDRPMHEIIIWPSVLFLAIFPALITLGTHFGPRVESPAVSEMKIDNVHCQGRDLIIDMLVTKGSRAEYVGMTVIGVNGLQQHRVMAWRYVTGADTAKGGLPIGEEAHLGPLLIVDGCNMTLEFHTRHRSAWGWWKMQGKFGPFGPYPVPGS